MLLNKDIFDLVKCSTFCFNGYEICDVSQMRKSNLEKQVAHNEITRLDQVFNLACEGMFNI